MPSYKPYDIYSPMTSGQNRYPVAISHVHEEIAPSNVLKRYCLNHEQLSFACCGNCLTMSKDCDMMTLAFPHMVLLD